MKNYYEISNIWWKDYIHLLQLGLVFLSKLALHLSNHVWIMKIKCIGKFLKSYTKIAWELLFLPFAGHCMGKGEKGLGQIFFNGKFDMATSHILSPKPFSSFHLSKNVIVFVLCLCLYLEVSLKGCVLRIISWCCWEFDHGSESAFVFMYVFVFDFVIVFPSKGMIMLMILRVWW